MKQDKKEGLSSKLRNKMAPLFEKVGALSRMQRILISVVAFGLIAGVYIYFFFMPLNKTLHKLEEDHGKLKQQLASYKAKAKVLDAEIKKMEVAQEQFNQAMTALPDKKEIPSLLTGISRSGNDAGLEFLLFQPAAEVQKEYYAEIPVSIKVEGNYHQIALFFDRVSRLNRTVNIKDISIGMSKKTENLETACTAVTYMFVEKKEEADKKDKTKSKKRRKRG